MAGRGKGYGFATLAVHGRKHADKHETVRPIRALSTPIFQSSTFAFESADQGARIFSGQEEGYFYTRLGNPTSHALEQEIAYLENGAEAVAFASGMAAISTLVLTLCRAGDNLVSANTLYGGTHKFFTGPLPGLAVEAREVPGSDLAAADAAIDGRTRLLYLETPANPTLEIVDIAAWAEIARRRGVPLAVDNTFCTPYLQNPLDLGADIVVHSATKYLGGHGDTVAGLVVGTKDFCGRMRAEFLRDLGGIISPFNAWLILRGLKTLPVRMDRHGESAMEVAQYLEFHPKVARVLYPGLRTHPQHGLAARQQRGFGGMVAFELKGGRTAGRALMDSVELCTLAVSLGDVDTLIEHPATMTHSTYDARDLAKAGITEGMVRLSVGLEDVDDVIEDLRQALGRV
jgi:methionine-gamma-lyase